MLMGGAGNDHYIVGTTPNTFIIVYENGGSSFDTIFTGLDLISGDITHAGTIDGRHLVLVNLNANRYSIIIDWEQPVNRLETWFVAGGIAYPPGMNYDQFRSLVVPDLEEFYGGTLPNVSFDELELEGFDSAAFNEMLAFYAQREQVFATNHPPQITALPPPAIPPRGTFHAFSFFSTSDPDGDSITKYEFTDLAPGGATFRIYDTVQPVGTPVIVTDFFSPFIGAGEAGSSDVIR